MISTTILPELISFESSSIECIELTTASNSGISPWFIGKEVLRNRPARLVLMLIAILFSYCAGDNKIVLSQG